MDYVLCLTIPLVGNWPNVQGAHHAYMSSLVLFNPLCPTFLPSLHALLSLASSRPPILKPGTAISVMPIIAPYWTWHEAKLSQVCKLIYRTPHKLVMPAFVENRPIIQCPNCAMERKLLDILVAFLWTLLAHKTLLLVQAVHT